MTQHEPSEPESIRAFARRVLHGATVDAKLRAPGPLTDTAPGPAEAARSPGRPPGLALRDPRPRPPFPRVDHLDGAEARGTVLHFFANHELMALELMAQALLRFPDAPPRFRAGLCGVMREEQDHLAAYLDRMAACGVGFGDVPVSPFFWDCLADAPDLPALVAGLSLTLEQANLDFAAYYADAFRAVGDADTAAVLDRVLADEIRHVAHGLTWFRQWRPGDLFDAWAAALPAPLTPRRARGIGFLRAPRRAAGFDDATIDRLAVYGASRGRRPLLYRFDPDVETELAGEPPSAAGRVIAADLDLLPLFLAGEDDAVLVHQPPRTAFLRSLRDAGFALPEHVTAIDDRAWGGHRPWALSPRVCAELAPHGGPAWRPAWRAHASKSWAAGLRGALHEALGEDFLAPPEDLGVVCHTVAEVAHVVRALDRPFVIKAPWSTAGRARKFALDLAWVEGTLATQGSVVVEPWLDRVADLSLQGTGGVLDGWGRFFTDARGAYRGAWLGHPLEGLPPDVQRWAHDDGRDPRRLPRTLAAVARFLGERLDGRPGPYGVDALIYRRPDGLRLFPLLEVNPRVTMGRIALALGRHVAPGTPARFDLVPRDAVAARPVVLRGGHIVDGALPLTDPERAQRVVAMLTVGVGAR